MDRVLAVLVALTLLGATAAAAACVKAVEAPTDDVFVVPLTPSGEINGAIGTHTFSTCTAVLVRHHDAHGTHVIAALVKAMAKATVKGVVMLIRNIV
jgi:hypothetical protein